MRFDLFLSFLLLPTLYCNAQTENESLEREIEAIAENMPEDFDYDELSDRLADFRKYPVDLNKADRGQLSALGLLSVLQLDALIRHREESGPFIDLLELQAVEGFGLDLVRRIVPYLLISGSNPLKGLQISKGEHDLILRYGQVLQKQEGYRTDDASGVPDYAGSAVKLFVRYRYRLGQHISVSANLEKDAGEQFFNGKPGLDFTSWNISLGETGKLGKCVIGDYSLQFGQGLTLWTGTAFGKGAAISAVPKQGNGLKPYSSAGEALFFRGAAGTVTLNKLSFIPFISFRQLDASSENAEQYSPITSIRQSGLHRTATELKGREILGQKIVGLNIAYKFPNFAAGMVVYHTAFSRKIAPGESLYENFDFTGTKLSNTGSYFQYNRNNLYFFGEVAHSLRSAYAYVGGLIGSLSSQVSAVLLCRDYGKHYTSFFSEAISESSSAINEKGTYTGLIIHPSRKLELNIYADVFCFPWLKYRVDGPSRGCEFFTQLNWTQNKSLSGIVRYRFRGKQENDDLKNTVNILQDYRKQNFRLETDLKIAKDFKIRNRAEFVWFKKEGQPVQRGFLIYQDLIWAPVAAKISGNTRFAIFDTSSFDAAVYAFENDVLYSYSVPVYQNSGTRFYLNGRFKLRRGVEAGLRYAQTRYRNQETIGSGGDMIRGSLKSDVKVQVRLQF